MRKRSDPNAIPADMTAKPKITTKNKMRQLHWTTVRPKEVKGSIWDGLDESGIAVNAYDFEDYFKQNIIKKNKKGQTTKANGSSSSSSQKKEEIHLIDGKRSYNVDIGLNRFKLSHEDMKNAILMLDETVLNIDKVSKLRKYVPTLDEQETLRSFDGDVTLLAHTERFFLALCNIGDLTGRMELWQFKMQFCELCLVCLERVRILRIAHDNVRNSKRFRVVLQYILAYGNYMNGGTRKGQAFGFKLSSLRQLISSKSTKNAGQTLLDYLINQMEMSDEGIDALKFASEDFKVLQNGSRMDVSQLTADVNKIGGLLRKITKKINDHDDKKNQNNDDINKNKRDLFVKVMKNFAQDAQPKFDDLKVKFDSTKNDCKLLAEFLNCKNDIKFEYFKLLYEFSQMVDQSCKKLKMQRERKLKEEKLKKQKQERRERLMSKNNNNNSVSNKNKRGSSAHKKRSSSGATMLYQQKGLGSSKKKTKNIGNKNSNNDNKNGGMDPQLAARLKQRKQKTKQAYPQMPDMPDIAAVRQSNYKKRKSKSRNSHASSMSGARHRSSPSAPLSPTISITKPNNVNNDILNLVEEKKFEDTGFGLPAPLYDGGMDDGGLELSVTESVLNDIKLSEVQNRRKQSAHIVGGKQRKYVNRQKSNNNNKASLIMTDANNKKKKKKKKRWKWGF